MVFESYLIKWTVLKGIPGITADGRTIDCLCTKTYQKIL
ncbi:MAG: hypothetical protein H6Q68_2103 [Firmicutes bacterium]|nr:hypothetical protein [Bacillota bacterium]